MEFSSILGAWVASFLTIGIFSYLYKDNPFYKIAEHVFVGVSAAYVAAISFWTQIYPNLLGRLFPKDGPLSFTGLEFDFNHSFISFSFVSEYSESSLASSKSTL